MTELDNLRAELGASQARIAKLGSDRTDAVLLAKQFADERDAARVQLKASQARITRAERIIQMAGPGAVAAYEYLDFDREVTQADHDAADALILGAPASRPEEK